MFLSNKSCTKPAYRAFLWAYTSITRCKISIIYVSLVHCVALEHQTYTCMLECPDRIVCSCRNHTVLAERYNIHVYINTCMDAYIHASICAHRNMRTHTHTYMYMCTYMLLSFLMCIVTVGWCNMLYTQGHVLVLWYTLETTQWWDV